MKRVPWTDIGKGQSAPLLTVGLRRHGVVMPVTPMLLVDTGADGTMLPRYWATSLGFRAADLIPEENTVAGGIVKVDRPSDLTGTEVEIDGVWLSLPSLRFADRLLFPLLGRDVIFANFDLKMTATDFHLLPLPKKK